MTTKTEPIHARTSTAAPTPAATQGVLSAYSETEPIPAGLWQSTACLDVFHEDFYDIMDVVAGCALSLEQAHHLAGCAGYALRATMAGEELSGPRLTYWREEGGLVTTTLEFAYDSTKSSRLCCGL